MRVSRSAVAALAMLRIVIVLAAVHGRAACRSPLPSICSRAPRQVMW
jgi:hypothetical protein